MFGKRARAIARFLSRVGIVLVAAALSGALAWLWGVTRPPLYAATATIMVRTVAEPGQEYEGARSDIARAPALAALSVSAERLETVSAELRLEQPVDELAAQLNARNFIGTPFFDITARAARPETAARIANVLAELAEASGSEGAGNLGTELVVIERAEPPSRPAYTRPLRDVATGALVGASIAVAGLIALRPRRTVADQPVRPAQLPTPILAGTGLAALMIASMAVGLPEPVPQGLTLLAAGLAVISPSAGLAILAIMLPLQDPVGFGPFSVDNLVVAGTAYGVLLDAVQRRARPRIGLPLVVLIAYLGLVVVDSLPVFTGLDGDRAVASFDRLLQLASGLVLVVAGAAHFARHDPRPILVLGVVSATTAAVLAIVQLLVGDMRNLPAAALFPPSDVLNAARPSGPFLNANYFGFLLALGMIIAIALWRSSRVRGLMSVCLLPIVLALVVGSLSRGALLAFGAGVLTLIWGLFRPRIALPLTACLVVAAVVLVPFLVESRLERSGAGNVSTAQAGVEESDQGRLDALTAALPLFRIDPVFGIGFGQYGFESARYVGSSQATASHDQYLNILAEQGLVGIAALVALAFALGASLRRAPPDLRALVAAMAMTYAVGAVFLEPLTHLQTSGIFWITVAAGVGPRAARSTEHTAERMTSPVTSDVAAVAT